MRLPVNWPSIRKAALARAGHRSARSGLVGRFEVHHKDGDRSNNLPENLEVLTRQEHVLEHHQPDPDREAWVAFMEGQINA